MGNCTPPWRGLFHVRRLWSDSGMSQLQVQLPMLSDGHPALPSVDRRADGKPRFYLPLVKELITADAGVKYIVTYESLYGGYEGISRKFFDEHLEPGDLFLDIGAHWGMFSLTAATRHPGQVRVLAVEPHPLNVTQLLKGVSVNRLHEVIDVVASAAGDRRGIARLRLNTTMGHSLDEATPLPSQAPLLVPVTTVDELLSTRPELAQGRVLMKIDVEGFEYEVLCGARQLMESGRVAAVMWEKGHSYGQGAGHEKMLKMIDEFDRYGFRLYRFPSSEFDGPLIPFAPTPEVGNVFALAPGFERKPVYELPFDPRPPFNNLFATPADPQTRAETTALLLAARSSDGARWANPAELQIGAAQRAAIVAPHLPGSGASVLDLGAGAMALAQTVMSRGGRYSPADLLRRSADCQIVDLNQGLLPQGTFDVAVLSRVLEFVHDVPAVLAHCRQVASKAVILYATRSGEEISQRREQGWFNDFSDSELAELVQRAGWRIETQQATAQGLLLVCAT
jgi:FkbM family methyltransferase